MPWEQSQYSFSPHVVSWEPRIGLRHSHYNFFVKGRMRWSLFIFALGCFIFSIKRVLNEKLLSPDSVEHVWFGQRVLYKLLNLNALGLGCEIPWVPQVPHSPDSSYFLIKLLFFVCLICLPSDDIWVFLQENLGFHSLEKSFFSLNNLFLYYLSMEA